VNLLVAAIRVAGAIQVLDIAANLALPRRIRCRENLARVSPLVRQIFLVHWLYILLVLAIFGVACLRFGPELAGGSGLGRFLSGVLAIFWLLRAGIQVFYFDADFRKQNRLGDLTFALSALYMGVVFAIAALRPLR
jgi:hypothetical protein